MKKIDKLVLGSFWGPFFLTLAVVIFIFLTRLLMQYIEEFVSKDLDAATMGRLLFYFALNTVPVALPLAVLLSSLMTFGNLGEFFELTALKSAGISLTRALRPLLLVAAGLAIFSFWYNNNVAPWANLKGWSLLYDIKSAKATLNLKEGIFYNDLPGYSIKVDKKEKDGVRLKGLVIYKHSPNGLESGNREVILADSGKMYTDPSRSYLTFELYHGNDYQEYADQSRTSYAMNTMDQGTAGKGQFLRNGFEHYKLIISLESFGLKRTDEQQFQYHEYMKNLSQLRQQSDSLRRETVASSRGLVSSSQQYFNYHFRPASNVASSVQPPMATERVAAALKATRPNMAPAGQTPSVAVANNVAPSSPAKPVVVKPGRWIDSLLRVRPVPGDYRQTALGQAQNMLSFAQSNQTYLSEKKKTMYRYELEMHHKFTQAISVFVMFLIGAPLGAIIRKGGFGVPVLVSIIFFILLYVFTLIGDKYAKDGLVWVPAGAWAANALLLPVGLYFMRQARHDSRLFDKDAYIIWWQRMRKKWAVAVGSRQ